jgi:hypothetical protein
MQREEGSEIVKIKKMVQYALGFQAVNFRIIVTLKDRFYVGSGGKQKECSNC